MSSNPFRVKVPLLTRQSFLDNGVHQLELVLQYGDQEEQVVLVDIHSHVGAPAEKQDEQVIEIPDHEVTINSLLNPSPSPTNNGEEMSGDSSHQIKKRTAQRRKRKCKKICQICHQKFANKQSVARHSFVHLNPEEKEAVMEGCKNKCYFCPKQVRSHLYRHLLIHTTEKPHPCDIDKCGKRFTQKSNLTTHQHLHNPGTRPSFNCTWCGKSFTLRRNLTTHVNTVHRRLKEFQCLECDRKFGEKGSMLDHLNAIHYGIRYPCRKTNCDKTFSHKGSLQKHEKRAH